MVSFALQHGQSSSNISGEWFAMRVFYAKFCFVKGQPV
jgi:hypothetical protein